MDYWILPDGQACASAKMLLHFRQQAGGKGGKKEDIGKWKEQSLLFLRIFAKRKRLRIEKPCVARLIQLDFLDFS